MDMEHRAPAWLALLSALAGCTGEPAPTSGAGWVPAGEERLTFAGGAVTQRAVRFDDGSEIEEYGRAAGAGWQVEYLYLAGDSPDHVLSGHVDPATSVGREDASGARRGPARSTFAARSQTWS